MRNAIEHDGSHYNACNEDLNLTNRESRFRPNGEAVHHQKNASSKSDINGVDKSGFLGSDDKVNQKDASPSLLRHGQKQGHICCVGCCDVRRAVIIINLVNFVLGFMRLAVLEGTAKYIFQSMQFTDDYWNNGWTFDDDTLENGWSFDQDYFNNGWNFTKEYFNNAWSLDDDYFKSGWSFDDDFFNQSWGVDVEHEKRALLDIVIGLAIADCMVHALIYVVGIAGAVFYNKWMVGICALVYCFDILKSLCFVNIVGAIINGLFAYPHFYLFQEIHEGIMTKENYSNEQWSCCCVKSEGKLDEGSVSSAIPRNTVNMHDLV